MNTIDRLSERITLPQGSIGPGRDVATRLPPLPGLLARFIALGRDCLYALAPSGYQDESGFHYGRQPIGNRLVS